jgi:outer membrane protein OmpA-like peptidoglycan-associated protein
MKSMRNTALAVGALVAAFLSWEGLLLAACSDEDFFKAEESYQKALQESAAETQIDLLETAFKLCPATGSYAQGYYLLGKLWYDRGDRNKAFDWLCHANRFKAVMLQRSADDLAQTNLLLGNLYREKGEPEKALIHLNIYRALTRFHDKSLDKSFIDNADSFLGVIYSPAAVKETLTIDKAVAREHRAQLNRLEVYFDFAKAALDDDAKKRLDGIGEALQSSGFVKCTMVVEGHTDQTGSEKLNCDLGAKRANAAVDYLKARWGITEANFVPISYGKSTPTVPRESGDRESWPKIDRFNRRVVIWNAGPQPDITKDITVEFGIQAPCAAKEKGRQQ